MIKPAEVIVFNRVFIALLPGNWAFYRTFMQFIAENWAGLFQYVQKTLF